MALVPDCALIVMFLNMRFFTLSNVNAVRLLPQNNAKHFVAVKVMEGIIAIRDRIAIKISLPNLTEFHVTFDTANT